MRVCSLLPINDCLIYFSDPDPCVTLNNLAQAKGWNFNYTEATPIGPEHARTWSIRVFGMCLLPHLPPPSQIVRLMRDILVNGEVKGTGIANSKKKAKHAAAADALGKLE